MEDRLSHDTQGTNSSGDAIDPGLDVALLLSSSSRRRGLRVPSMEHTRTRTIKCKLSSRQVGSYSPEVHFRLLFQKPTCEVRRI